MNMLAPACDFAADLTAPSSSRLHAGVRRAAPSAERSDFIDRAYGLVLQTAPRPAGGRPGRVLRAVSRPCGRPARAAPGTPQPRRPGGARRERGRRLAQTRRRVSRVRPDQRTRPRRVRPGSTSRRNGRSAAGSLPSRSPSTGRTRPTRSAALNHPGVVPIFSTRVDAATGSTVVVMRSSAGRRSAT